MLHCFILCDSFVCNCIVLEVMCNRTCFFLEVILFGKDDRSLYITTITASVINAIFSVVAIFGNSVILLVVFRTTALRTCSNLFLGNLVLADLLVGAMVQPLFVIYKAKEILGTYSCDVHIMFSTSAWLCAGVSFLSLTALNCERQIAIFAPLRYKTLVNPRTVLRISIVIWVASLLLVSSRFYGLSNGAFYIICCVIIVISLTTFLVISVQIHGVARRHRMQISHEQNDQQRGRQRIVAREASKAKNVAWVTFIFVLCFLPTLIVMIVYTIVGYSAQLKTVYVWSDTLVFLNSSMNPVLYCWRNKGIRKAALRLLYLESIFVLQPRTTLWNGRQPTRTAPQCNVIPMSSS